MVVVSIFDFMIFEFVVISVVFLLEIKTNNFTTHSKNFPMRFYSVNVKDIEFFNLPLKTSNFFSRANENMEFDVLAVNTFKFRQRFPNQKKTFFVYDIKNSIEFAPRMRFLWKILWVYQLATLYVLLSLKTLISNF